ncbi:serine/threonine protein phosphatase 2A regulatory subunit B'' subunit gamma [Reticulomyxa filosa]|uniref:Serine/threonine protein phosphatase 2A regulatory subunit B'' subunit gamma n=1 Tax=Reticulomyxa filosa TaxID=46433 RepID=X6NXE5_RETFI|nr:serine/threonine protein phosphatase 2A regulatory subunit B'' subunit gamma [Reticulomyxa filosa]|eukprot:ETO30975.1 serine/threonine protein phosphatase 2A regulatory subunit B'' subunit gamma [Reticulomyxa filosa]
MLHHYVTMCRYDGLGEHYITEADLEVFIADQIEMIGSLSRIEESFQPYYIYHAVRKFMFMLDPKHKGKNYFILFFLIYTWLYSFLFCKIPITEMLCSDVFQELNQFRFEHDDTSNTTSSANGNCIGTDGTTKSNSSGLNETNNNNSNNNINNWFSPQYAMKVYRLYLQLDTDRKGTLNKTELLQFNNSSLSNLCVDRLFEVKKTWDHEFDYKGFLDFIIAVENKKTFPAFCYFWEVLDLQGQGYLTPFDIRTLFRVFRFKKKWDYLDWNPQILRTLWYDTSLFSEIVDMVHPNDNQKITQQELYKSGMHATIIDILTDVKGFWEYDNREAIILQGNNEEDL